MDNDIDTKYIRRYSRGWIVDIRKGDHKYLRRFPSRSHGGSSEALQAAREDRDRQHSLLFGFLVTERPIHTDKRKGAESEFEGLDLPVGISVQRVRGRPLYFVVRPINEGEQKTRFNIEEHGLFTAYNMAIDLQHRRLVQNHLSMNAPSDG